MTERSTPSPILGGFAQVGKYFQLVSIIPALVIVLGVAGLVAAGAPAKRPTWDLLLSSGRSVDLQSVTALAVATLVVGMALNPFQFTMIQLLEGYWGPSEAARFAMWSRASLHLRNWRRYSAEAVAWQVRLESIVALAEQTTSDTRRRAQEETLQAALYFQEFDRAFTRYPEDLARVMPTRLGNVLRRYEDLAGQPYELESVDVVPHLLALSEGSEVEFVEDARGALDLAIRFVISWLLFALISFVLLWPYGPWVSIPLCAYGFAWMSYRGAVHAAAQYGSSLSVLIDLNRHKLEECFQPFLPKQEPMKWGRVISDLAGRRSAGLAPRHRDITGP